MNSLLMLAPHIMQAGNILVSRAEIECTLALRELASGGEAVLVTDEEGRIL